MSVLSQRFQLVSQNPVPATVEVGTPSMMTLVGEGIQQHHGIGPRRLLSFGHCLLLRQHRLDRVELLG